MTLFLLLALGNRILLRRLLCRRAALLIDVLLCRSLLPNCVEEFTLCRAVTRVPPSACFAVGALVCLAALARPHARFFLSPVHSPRFLAFGFFDMLTTAASMATPPTVRPPSSCSDTAVGSGIDVYCAIGSAIGGAAGAAGGAVSAADNAVARGAIRWTHNSSFLSPA